MTIELLKRELERIEMQHAIEIALVQRLIERAQMAGALDAPAGVATQIPTASARHATPAPRKAGAKPAAPVKVAARASAGAVPARRNGGAVSMRDQIRAWINDREGEFTSMDIRRAFVGLNPGSLSCLINNLKVNGSIELVKFGRYKKSAKWTSPAAASAKERAYQSFRAGLDIKVPSDGLAFTKRGEE